MSDLPLAAPASAATPRSRSALADFGLRLRQNAPLVFAVALFSILYLLYQLRHPKGFTTQVLVQNANEAFTLSMVAMAQTVPVLLGGSTSPWAR